MPRILHLVCLASSKNSIKKEGCWLLSNIAAGTETQVQRLISTPQFIESVTSVLQKEKDFAVVKEAIWVIANMFRTITESQLENIFNSKLIESAVNALRTVIAVQSYSQAVKAILRVFFEGLQYLVEIVSIEDVPYHLIEAKTKVFTLIAQFY